MRVIRRLCFLLLILPILSRGASPAISGSERDKKTDAALYHYYSGQTEAAKNIAKELRESFPNDPFFHELMGEIVWKELEKKVDGATHEKYERVNARTVGGAEFLIEQFYREIYDGLVLAQPIPGQNPLDSKHVFLRGMLLIRLGGFIAKFEPGIRSYMEADLITAEGIQLVQKSMREDPSLCSAKYVFALGKYSIIKGVGRNFFYRAFYGPIVRFHSRVLSALGGNFNINDVFVWLRESMNCSSPYYYTKDVNIDKKFVYQDILIGQGRMDKEALPVIEELHSAFPENTVIRDNLILVRARLKKQR